LDVAPAGYGQQGAGLEHNELSFHPSRIDMAHHRVCPRKQVSVYVQADASQKLKKREAAVKKEDRRQQQSGPCRSQEVDEEEKQQLQLQVGHLNTSFFHVRTTLLREY